MRSGGFAARCAVGLCPTVRVYFMNGLRPKLGRSPSRIVQNHGRSETFRTSGGKAAYSIADVSAARLGWERRRAVLMRSLRADRDDSDLLIKEEL